MDEDALRAVADGVSLNFDTESAASASAERLRKAFSENQHPLAVTPEITVQKEERTDRYRLLLARRIHGNLKLSVINSDFVAGFWRAVEFVGAIQRSQTKSRQSKISGRHLSGFFPRLSVLLVVSAIRVLVK